MTENKLPKWFEGELYEEGATVKNRFSGEEYKLNAMELSMYDFIKGAEIMLGTGDIFEKKSSQIQNEMRKGLDWFRKNNAKAYMVLLD